MRFVTAGTAIAAAPWFAGSGDRSRFDCSAGELDRNDGGQGVRGPTHWRPAAHDR